MGHPSWVTTGISAGLLTALGGKCWKQAPARGAPGELGAWALTQSQECLSSQLWLLLCDASSLCLTTMTATAGCNETHSVSLAQAAPPPKTPAPKVGCAITLFGTGPAKGPLVSGGSRT